MKQIRLLSGLVFLLLLVSCEKDIEFSGEITEPLLVVNSLATPDSIITVKVTESRFFLSNGYTFEPVTDATVKLFINGVFNQEMEHVSDGIYESDFKPVSGERIHLEISAPGFDPVESEVLVPEKTSIISIDTTISLSDSYPMLNGNYYGSGSNSTIIYDTIGYYYNNEYNITMNFKDPSEEVNYYRLAVMAKKTFDDGTINESYSFFEFTDIVSGNSTANENSIFDFQSTNNTYNVFSDELFNGNEYPLKFKVNQSVINYKPGFEGQGYYERNPEKVELLIDLQSVSKSYYLYMKTLSSYTGESNFFSEPVQIHSNIEGGIGIFGSYTRNIKSIVLTP